jgi:acetolactate synthase-1/2/3 large subunit
VTTTGSDILVHSLRQEGVDVVFGHPGGAVLFIYDAIYRHEFRHILARHEQGAVHMADGYARATGRVGVALVTSGPALTNAITGIATAYSDSIPIVVISGQVAVPAIGSDAFQEADNVGLTRPVTKHNYLVKDVRDLAATIKEAFFIARSGRPGPVLVDIPKDVSNHECEFHYPSEIQLDHYQPRYEGHWGQIKKALTMILQARRPVLYFGGGVILSGAAEEMRRFAEKLRAPTTYTLMGIGGIPGDHPLSLGMLGMHGHYRANLAVDQSDVLVAIGARFDDRVTGKLDEFSRRSRKIHIDIDPTSIRKTVHVDIPIVGDVELSPEAPEAPRRRARARAVLRADRALVAADRGVAGGESDRLRAGRRRAAPAPVRDRQDLPDDTRRSGHHDRRRAASDVGGAVLSLPAPQQLGELGWARHDGLRPPLRDRGAGRATG